MLIIIVLNYTSAKPTRGFYIFSELGWPMENLWNHLISIPSRHAHAKRGRCASSHCLPLIIGCPQLPGLWGPGFWLTSSIALIWASLWFEEYRALLGCCPRAMLECKSSVGGAEGSDLTVWCEQEYGARVTHWGWLDYK